MTLCLLYCLSLLVLPYVMDQPTVPLWCMALQLSQHWPAHHLEVVGLSVFCGYLAIDRALSLKVCHSRVPASFHLFLFLCLSLLCLCELYPIESKPLASTLWTQDSAHSLLVSSVSSSHQYFTEYFTYHTSLPSPCIDCSVSLLSYLLWSQSGAFICNLPIHS